MEIRARIALGVVCFLLGAALPVRAQTGAPPVIDSINPSTVAAGGPGFTLTVTGSGYVANSVVQVNGNTRATTVVSGTQLMAMILPGAMAVAGPVRITVFNAIAGVPNGGQTANTATLQVGNPPPTLTSIAPGIVAQGSGEVRMTLIGANFRPGAVVVISPPVTSVSNSTASVQAADIAIENVQRVSNNILIALVSLGPEATSSLRAVDVAGPLEGQTQAMDPKPAEKGRVFYRVIYRAPNGATSAPSPATELQRP